MCDKSYTTPRGLSADTESVSELTETVARLTGMEISVWGADFRPCGYGGHTNGELCNLLHGCGLGRELCIGADNEALRTAQAHGPYCYRCPIGLTEIAVPIRRGERLLGFVMAGKVAEDVPDCDAEIRRTVLSRCPEAERLPRLDDAIAGVPHLTAERLTDSLRLLAAFAEILAERGSPLQSNQSMSAMVQRFLDCNFDRRVTLDELSVRFHCSTVTLTGHFKREYGVTVLQYLNARRLARAEKMLLRTDMTLGEISDRCGFSDAEYFSRVFRRAHGVSPLRYRQGAEG